MEKMVPAAVCSGIPDGHAGADLTGGGGWGVRPSAGPVPPGPAAGTSGEKRAARDRGGGGEGDRVSSRKIAEDPDWLPEKGDIPGASVLYEEGAVAILNKPPDVHTEPHRPREAGTLAGV